MSTFSKVPLSALPLPPPSHILTHNLTPDPRTPSPLDLHKVQRESPSIQRRARLLSSESHFSYVTPCPMPFPFRITPEEGEDVTDQSAFIEKWLSERESLNKPSNTSTHIRPSRLNKFYPKKRDQPLELIGLSETGLRDCVPHLHVGDAFDLLGSPTLSRPFDDDKPRCPTVSEEDIAAREELIDVLSGHATLMSVSKGEAESWAPWSLRYSGHQFGTWAGQLGDGRAISILATPHPSDRELVHELQLKGAGRTPFSRSADGLAVARSSIREFLGAEAMYALDIPTTRSLSLVSLPTLPVLRETVESACVLTRVAPSFIRIGSFEALNPPQQVFFLGGQQDSHWDALRLLGEWVGRRVLKLPGIKWKDADGEDGDPWGRQLVLEVARRNAKMVAGWQAYGFMHGVINTDNVSILGFTIDYGPYAFMDVFNQYHICNHSDSEGRYTYNNQPAMVLYALRALVNALAPIIGAETTLTKAASSGWADNVEPSQIDRWRKEGTELVLEEVEKLFQDTCSEEYRRLMNKRLALRRIDQDDENRLRGPLLNFMSEHQLDFHSTFRRLAAFRPSWIQSTGETPDNADKALDDYIASLLSLTPDPESMDKARAADDWKSWLKRYASRIYSERDEWGDGDFEAEREMAAKAANPRFVLRQWVLEEVIKKVEQDMDTGKRVLRKVLQMACSPFEPWGAEDDLRPEESLDQELKEERRFCGLGEKKMLGFQCSCSS